METLFGTLRAMLEAPEPTKEWYDTVGDLFFEAHKLDAERYTEEWIPYAARHDCWSGTFATFEDLAGLEQWYAIAPFATFAFASTSYEDLEHFAPVFESPAASRIGSLSLVGTSAGPELARAIAAAPLESLRELCLRDNELRDEGVAALAEAAWAPALRTLDLEGAWATYAGLEALGTSGAFTALESLNYSGNPIDDVERLYESEWFEFPSLRSLDLLEAGMDQDVLNEIIGEIGFFTGVCALDLSLNEGMGPYAVQIVARAGSTFPELEELRMRGSTLSMEGVEALDEAMSRTLSKLTVIHIDDDDIDGDAFEALEDATLVAEALQRGRDVRATWA
ncbi:MAG: hypothetical protein GY884_35835 [Proteobacteria bacterium]|nr:hypothetical protein [Pseudomonadota bacterium]